MGGRRERECDVEGKGKWEGGERASEVEGMWRWEGGEGVRLVRESESEERCGKGEEGGEEGRIIPTSLPGSKTWTTGKSLLTS